MNRRRFLVSSSGAGATLASGAALHADPPAPAKRTLMKLGCQSAPTNEAHLKYFARYGVRNICGYPEIPAGQVWASADDLRRMRELAEKNGVSVDCTAPPILASSHIDSEKHPGIMLAQSPERDRDIEDLQNFIKGCAAAGIPAIKYNMSLLGVVRTEHTQGRGDAMYSTWKHAGATPRTPLTRAGRVNADQYWERITYFLDRVIPVANEFKIRMACHPHDPGMPPEGYQGVDTVLGTVDGLKRFVSIRESPYHGINFCQGTVSEMLQDPGKEIFAVIRYFGSRKKIFNVHFRNIRGRRSDFQEVFPDEGSIDFVEAIKTYRDVDYPYMLMPDHVPTATADPRGLQSFAFCYGYIRALIQALDRIA